MQPHEVVVPIIFFATIAGIWIVYLIARHKERLTIIEKGLGSEEIKSLYLRGAGRPNPLSALKWGLILVGAGAGALLAMWLDRTFMLEDGVYPAIIALFGGIALVIFYLISRKRTQE
jgi:hypothetical protein